MITIQSGKMMIPEEERFVGFAGDDRSNTKQFIIPQTRITDIEAVFSLYLRFDDDSVTSAPLTISNVDSDTVLTWNVRAENLLRPGIVMAQIKYTAGDGTVTHYSWDYFVVGASAEFADDGSEIDMLNRTEFEERMAQAVSDARATAPYIGADGYWYVYSRAQGDYVRSISANNITVDSEVSSSSANPVENRTVKAYIDAADNAKVDKTTRVAGHALSDNISADDLYESMAGKINPPLVTIGVSSGYPAQYGKTADGVPVFCQGLSRWIPLAKAEDIPTQTSDLTNDSGFLTAHQDITGKVDKTQTIAGIDLQDDITAAELKTALSVPVKISDLDSAANMGQGFVRLYKANFDETPSNVSGSYYDPGFRLYDIIYYPKVGAFYQCTSFSKYVTTYNETRYRYQITKINLNTSQLNNDAGFLTQHQDISGKMNLAGALVQTNVSGTAPDTTDPVFTALPNNQIFQCYIAGNLTYWMKYSGTAYRIALYSDLPAVPTRTSDLTNDSGFIDSGAFYFECTVDLSVDLSFHVVSHNVSLASVASLIDNSTSVWCIAYLYRHKGIFPLTSINYTSSDTVGQDGEIEFCTFGGIMDTAELNMGLLYITLTFKNNNTTILTTKELSVNTSGSANS